LKGIEMKINVFAAERTERVQTFKPFTVDTEKHPELELEVQAITSAYKDGVEPDSQTMKFLMGGLQEKMFQVDFSVDKGDQFGHVTSLWDHFAPLAVTDQISKDNEISLRFDHSDGE
jgi:hypothetical protein